MGKIFFVRFFFLSLNVINYTFLSRVAEFWIFRCAHTSHSFFLPYSISRQTIGGFFITKNAKVPSASMPLTPSRIHNVSCQFDYLMAPVTSVRVRVKNVSNVWEQSRNFAEVSPSHVKLAKSRRVFNRNMTSSHESRKSETKFSPLSPPIVKMRNSSYSTINFDKK